MRWLKSATQKVWTISGYTIPANVTPHNDYLKLAESEYNGLYKQPVVKSLISSKSILVFSEEPVELVNTIDNLKEVKDTLKEENENLKQQVEELKQKVEELTQAASDNKKSRSSKSEVEAIKKEAEETIASLKEEALKELQEKQARIEELEAELALYKKEK